MLLFFFFNFPAISFFPSSSRIEGDFGFSLSCGVPSIDDTHKGVFLDVSVSPSLFPFFLDSSLFFLETLGLSGPGKTNAGFLQTPFSLPAPLAKRQLFRVQLRVSPSPLRDRSRLSTSFFVSPYL